MHIPPSLCIDLGASFTKVAFRDRVDGPSHLLRDPELTFDDGRFCVPSVAARNRETNAWVFGAQAMDYRSGGKVQVFQNWKADLFLPESDRPGTIDLLRGASPEATELLLDAVPHLRAMDVAARFLCWLYDEQLPTMLGHREFTRAQVQICVPEFVRGDPSFAATLDLVMRWAGFRNPGGFTLAEPKANLIGILTRGENHITKAGRPNLGAMLGDAEILRALSKPDQAVLFVDIGAYTTDLALVNLALHQGGGFEDAPASSSRLGVRTLDALVLAEATAAERERVEASALDREELHAKYSETHFTGGDPFEVYGLRAATVAGCQQAFTEQVLVEIRRFLAEHAVVPPFAAVLTGGGSCVSAIADPLAAALTAVGVRWFHAPERTRTPRTVLHVPLRDELVRGASAIGGASILFA